MARIHLVDAFLSSEIWKPSDLALTACRSMDVDRILKRVAKTYRGKTYLESIASDLNLLPSRCRDQIKKAIKRIDFD